MKKFLTILILATLGGGGWYAYSQKWFGLNAAQKKEAAGNTGGPMATVEIRDIEYSVQVSGDVLPATQLDVKAEVGGRIKKLNVIAGMTVKAGEVLVEIDDRDILTERETALTEIEGARLLVEKIEKNFLRAEDLFKQNLISKEANDNLGSELALARNSFAKAERRRQIVDDKLSKTKVIAPGDGTVLTVPVVQGQVVIPAASVNSGTTLMTIANLSTLLVETHVNQVDVAKLTLKQDVSLTAESVKDEQIDAIISFVAPVASVKNGVKGFTVQAIIEKPSQRLRPGMSVQLTIPVAHAEDVVSVPVGAVFRGEGGARVVYVLNQGKPVRRVVKVGVSNTDHAQILEGLQEGDQILLNEPERGNRKRS
jgi:HlyD family secretion protein